MHKLCVWVIWDTVITCKKIASCNGCLARTKQWVVQQRGGYNGRAYYCSSIMTTYNCIAPNFRGSKIRETAENHMNVNFR